VDGGDWRQRDGELVQHDSSARSATALLANVPPCKGFLFEVNVRLLEASHQHSRYGMYLNHAPGDQTSLTLAADSSGLLCDRDRGANTWRWRRAAHVGGLGGVRRYKPYSGPKEVVVTSIEIIKSTYFV
jgi:hypothetical protein